MNIDKLKNKILQLAIQGKLVEQDENDESADMLYEKIQEEKEQLIKEKKIKRVKVDDIEEEEIPFEIPMSWKWIRLGGICYNLGQKKPDIKFTYIDVNSIDNKIYRIKKDLKVLTPEKAPSRARKLVNESSVIYSTVRPYLLNIAIINKSFEFEPIVSTAFAVMNTFNGINNKFLFYYLISNKFINYVESQMVGMAYPAINDSKLFRGLFPLPPLNEQIRIVEKIDELFKIADEFNNEKEDILKLVQKTRDCVLTKAIQGKLVEQDENDESAEILYEKIQEEKEKLIKEKKIRKGKLLQDITRKEKPFIIPYSWEWVRLGDILIKLTDGAHHTPKYTSSGIPFISVKDVSSGKINFSNTRFISKSTHDELFKRCNPEYGDLLLTKVGTTGIPVVVDIDIEFSLFVSVALLKFNTNLIHNKYLMNLINSPLIKEKSEENTRGVANKNLVLRDIANFAIPLPPLNEQKRIVEKIDIIMDYLDEIEAFTI